MARTFMPSYKTDEELEQLQLEGLKWTLNHVYSGSAFYRQRLDEAGVKPEDIKTLGDLHRLPFVDAYDLREQYPFPLLSVPVDDLVRIHASSGTTGKRKVMCYTQKDLTDYRRMFARVFEMAGLTTADRVQNPNGYGLWTAGSGFQAGIEEFGALCIPTGPGNLDLQLELLVDFKVTVYCSTASASLLLGESVEKAGIRDQLSLRKLIMGSEFHSTAMDARIAELLGLDPVEVYDIPGMTEMYGPGTGLDCRFHTGIHYWADYFIIEILDPQTLQPVPEGEAGEMVVTSLRKEGSPLVRYRTHDLCRLIPGRCPCGSVLPRHDKIMGRTDDMIIFKATNIYPGQLVAVLSKFDHVSSEYNLILERKGGKDYMEIKVERNPESDPAQDAEAAAQIVKRTKAEVMVTPSVTIVDYMSLPRSDRKSKRVFDNRQ